MHSPKLHAALLVAFMPVPSAIGSAIGSAVGPAVDANKVGAATCETRANGPSTKHAVCRFMPRPGTEERPVEVDFLYLKGPLEDTAREHGKLLARKIADGTARFVAEGKARLFGTFRPAERKVYEALSSCFMGNFRLSLPASYFALHENMAVGMREAGVTGLDSDALLEMSLSVELQALVSTLERRLEDDPLGALASLAAQCGMAPALPDLRAVLRAQGGPTRFEWGCTGAVATRGATVDGSLLHARNVDSSALGFVERTPLVILHDPPGRHRYVGVASPGLHFSGGSSGFNDAGVSVSLHAVSTKDLRNRFFLKEGQPAFYLQNRVLAESDSIDEAFALVSKAGRFTGWTMVISDAKTGETAAIEWTGSKAVLTRRRAEGFLAQSNHFLDPAMADRDYAYSYGKLLESIFRLERVTELFEKAPREVDSQWLMRLLGDQFDRYQGRRAFGRSVAKTFTTMSHVMDPSPATRLFHMSLGDRLPVTLGRFLSFRVDFDAAARGGTPFALVALTHPRKGSIEARPSWTASQSRYVEAWMDYRDHGDAALPAVIEKLDEASALASQDGITEFPFLYMRGRVSARASALALRGVKSWDALGGRGGVSARVFDVRAARSALSESLADFDRILAWDASEPGTLHPYDVANTHLWKARTLQLRGALDGLTPDAALEDPGVRRHLETAHALYAELVSRGADPTELRRLAKGYRDGITGRWKTIDAEAFLAPGVDFITVE